MSDSNDPIKVDAELKRIHNAFFMGLDNGRSYQESIAPFHIVRKLVKKRGVKFADLFVLVKNKGLSAQYVELKAKVDLLHGEVSFWKEKLSELTEEVADKSAQQGALEKECYALELEAHEANCGYNSLKGVKEPAAPPARSRMPMSFPDMEIEKRPRQPFSYRKAAEAPYFREVKKLFKEFDETSDQKAEEAFKKFRELLFANKLVISDVFIERAGNDGANVEDFEAQLNELADLADTLGHECADIDVKINVLLHQKAVLVDNIDVLNDQISGTQKELHFWRTKYAEELNKRNPTQSPPPPPRATVSTASSQTQAAQQQTGFQTAGYPFGYSLADENAVVAWLQQFTSMHGGYSLLTGSIYTSNEMTRFIDIVQRMLDNGELRDISGTILTSFVVNGVTYGKDVAPKVPTHPATKVVSPQQPASGAPKPSPQTQKANNPSPTPPSAPTQTKAVSWFQRLKAGLAAFGVSKALSQAPQVNNSSQSFLKTLATTEAVLWLQKLTATSIALVRQYADISKIKNVVLKKFLNIKNLLDATRGRLVSFGRDKLLRGQNGQNSPQEHRGHSLALKKPMPAVALFGLVAVAVCFGFQRTHVGNGAAIHAKNDRQKQGGNERRTKPLADHVRGAIEKPAIVDQQRSDAGQPNVSNKESPPLKDKPLLQSRQDHDTMPDTGPSTGSSKQKDAQIVAHDTRVEGGAPTDQPASTVTLEKAKKQAYGNFATEAVRLCSLPPETALDQLQKVVVDCRGVSASTYFTLESDPNVKQSFLVSTAIHDIPVSGWAAKESFRDVVPDTVGLGLPRRVTRSFNNNGVDFQPNVALLKGEFHPFVYSTAPSHQTNILASVDRAAINVPGYWVEVNWCHKGNIGGYCEVGAKLPGYGDVFGLVREQDLSYSRPGSYGDITGEKPKYLPKYSPR